MSSDRRVLVATRNAGKLLELRPMLASSGFEPMDLAQACLRQLPEEDAVESHATFEENALAKARYFAARCPGMSVLADDSGLVVEALGGAPGVLSRRWAALSGEQYTGDGHDRDTDRANNARLMREMAGVRRRAASFVCAAAWVGEGREFVARGEVAGEILQVARGHGGFGYDAYFLSSELGRSFGEASAAEKARVSHRARAVTAVLLELSGPCDPE